MPVVTVKNNGPNPVGFINVDGTQYVVPPKGEAEVDLDQRDVDGVYDLCERCKVIAEKESERTQRPVTPQLEVKGGSPSAEAKKHTVRADPVVRTASDVHQAGDEGGEVKRRK